MDMMEGQQPTRVQEAVMTFLGDPRMRNNVRRCYSRRRPLGKAPKSKITTIQVPGDREGEGGEVEGVSGYRMEQGKGKHCHQDASPILERRARQRQRRHEKVPVSLVWRPNKRAETSSATTAIVSHSILNPLP